MSKRAHLLNSGVAEGIRTVGFRRWYERELLSGHAHLVLLLLSVVGVMACLELNANLRGGERLLNAVYVMLCAAIGVWALRRYLYLLMRAEDIANQANCPSCGTYGRLTVVAEEAQGSSTEVACRRCAHRWRIEE